MSRGWRCSACRDRSSRGGAMGLRGRTRGGRHRVLELCRACMWKVHGLTNDFLERTRREGRYWEKC